MNRDALLLVRAVAFVSSDEMDVVASLRERDTGPVEDATVVRGMTRAHVADSQ
jgi:hypothetical protein